MDLILKGDTCLVILQMFESQYLLRIALSRVMMEASLLPFLFPNRKSPRNQLHAQSWISNVPFKMDPFQLMHKCSLRTMLRLPKRRRRRRTATARRSPWSRRFAKSSHQRIADKLHPHQVPRVTRHLGLRARLLVDPIRAHGTLLNHEHRLQLVTWLVTKGRPTLTLSIRCKTQTATIRIFTWPNPSRLSGFAGQISEPSKGYSLRGIGSDQVGGAFRRD